MTCRFAGYVLAGLAIMVPPTATQAQEQAALQVFLDCHSFHCDFDHVRREITFVSWVRDRADAGVHVLVTQQQTGGGGAEITLAFIGLRAHAGKADTLRYFTSQTDTQAEARDGLTQQLALGLVRYAAGTDAGRDLRVVHRPAGLTTPPQAGLQQHDPWNYWAFRVSLNGSLDGEATQSGYAVRGSASANRTTESLKLEFGVFGRYSRDEFELDDSTTFINISENYSADLLSVWSLNDHWSAGLSADLDRSTRSNTDLAVSGGPAIEYNIFPYQESTRKKLTLLYTLEVAAFDFDEITVDSLLSEIHPRHRLEVGASVTQPWGSIFGSVSGTQYLHDLAAHRIDTFAGANIRIFRGLDFNMFGSLSRIKDQFFLPAAGLTTEEILVRRRQRETDYRFDISIGFSYRFGSKFNNVVNPRMGGGSGFFIMM